MLIPLFTRNRLIGLLGLLLAFASAAPAADTQSPVFLTDQRIDRLRDDLAHQREPAHSAFGPLQQQADDALDRAPRVPDVWHVPFFYEDADGHRQAKRGLMDDANDAYTLALAYRILDDPRYADAAVRIIDAWSGLEHLETGEDSQLSFSYHFPAMIFAADLLRGYNGWPEDRQQAFRDFARDKAVPMNTMDRGNNWGNWGLVLVLAAAAYTDDSALFQEGIDRWKHFIAAQIADDGHLPHEVSRNHGRGDYGIWYSHFTLLPQTLAAEIARTSGVDLYDHQAPNGRTLQLAFETLAPWADDPASFPHFQGDDLDELRGTDYVNYFEILHPRWPNAHAARALQCHRPTRNDYTAPHLTFTHGQPLD